MTDDGCNRRPITAGQWQAARAISEGAPATRARVAALLGCDISSVYARAATEGWKQINFRGRHAQEAHAEFIAAVARQDDDESDDGLHGDAALDREISTDAGSVPGRSGADEQDTEPAADPDWSDDDAVVEAARRARLGRRREQEASPAVDGDRDDDDPAGTLARGARFMSRRLGRMIRRAERGGGLNKTEIDSLTALGRMMERWETLAAERAKQEETQSDADLAETYRKIDRRILYLARQEAERMVAAGYRPDDGAEGL